MLDGIGCKRKRGYKAMQVIPRWCVGGDDHTTCKDGGEVKSTVVSSGCRGCCCFASERRVSITNKALNRNNKHKLEKNLGQNSREGDFPVRAGLTGLESRLYRVDRLYRVCRPVIPYGHEFEPFWREIDPNSKETKKLRLKSGGIVDQH
jgi:hypothetical protein